MNLKSPNQISLDRLELALKNSWSIDTSHISVKSTWSKDNSALGQCSVTSLVVNHFFGGKIVKAKVIGEITPHYWNILPNNQKVDLTLSQFQNANIEFYDSIVVDINKLIEDSDLVRRLEILLKRVNINLAKV